MEIETFNRLNTSIDNAFNLRVQFKDYEKVQFLCGLIGALQSCLADLDDESAEKTVRHLDGAFSASWSVGGSNYASVTRQIDAGEAI